MSSKTSKDPPSSMMTLIHKQDEFSQNLQLNYAGQTQITSFLGGISSIIIKIGLIGMFYMQCSIILGFERYLVWDTLFF